MFRIAAAFIALALPSMAGAQQVNPLLAVDTTSPRATIRTFHQITDAVEKAAIELQSAPSAANQAEVERLMQKALSTWWRYTVGEVQPGPVISVPYVLYAA